MARFYVLMGPAECGNDFGSFGHSVPEGKFLPVEDGAYSNGGFGPSSVGCGYMTSLERAERYCAARNRGLNHIEAKAAIKAEGL